MKLPIVLLPTLLQVAAFAVIFHATSAVPRPSLSHTETLTEIRRLHQERVQVERQIAELKSRRGFLPRGVSYEAGATPATTPLSQTAAK